MTRIISRSAFRRHKLRTLLRATLVLTLLPALGQAAWAQSTSPIARGSGGASGGAADSSGKGAATRPPALPGTKTERVAPAPFQQLPTDMPPTEALFDAINRGDIATARDAIARGAELNGRNVLGLTPLDLAIDLGRNDITFLLLSLRASENRKSAGPGPGRADNAKSARMFAAQPAVKPVKPARVTAPTAPATAKLFAGNGGTPVPDAGFLGFDPGR